MHQLIIGTDVVARDKILNELRSRFLKTPDASKFDYTQIDAQGLDFNDLKAALLTVPAVAPKRIVLIARAHKLDDRNLALIEHAVADPGACCVVVLEADSWDRRSAVRKRLADKMKVCGQAASPGIFDILADMRTDQAGVMARMQELMADDAVENILGAMRWWWAHKAKGTMPLSRYKEGLLVIQEADERIKLSSLLTKEQAVEVVLVKLSLLLKV